MPLEAYTLLTVSYASVTYLGKDKTISQSPALVLPPITRREDQDCWLVDLFPTVCLNGGFSKMAIQPGTLNDAEVDGWNRCITYGVTRDINTILSSLAVRANLSFSPSPPSLLSPDTSRYSDEHTYAPYVLCTVGTICTGPIRFLGGPHIERNTLEDRGNGRDGEQGL